MIDEINMLVHGTPCSMVRLTIQTEDGEYTVIELNKETAKNVGVVFDEGAILIQYEYPDFLADVLNRKDRT